MSTNNVDAVTTSVSNASTGVHGSDDAVDAICSMTSLAECGE